MTPEILYEDKEIIVCLKPAGIPTQSRRIGTPDMESLLKNHLNKTAPRGRSPYLAVIHRLDQPVEGLLVFAKTPAAAKDLNRQLSNSGFGKHYLALLSHIPPKDEATLEHFLVKDGKANISRVCSPDTPGAKKARLHYKIIQKKEDSALAEITLDTGRHHQIRVQMAAIGCPITGDKKYGDHSDAAARDASKTADNPTDRLCLFAFRLDFFHPISKKPLHFSYDVPI